MRPEAHEPDEAARPGELANDSEARCDQGPKQYIWQVRKESQRSYLGRSVVKPGTVTLTEKLG